MLDFTVEESNLLSIYVGKTRSQTILELGEALVNQKDDEMTALIMRVIRRLDSMTDEQFAEYEFVAAEAEK